MCYFTCIACRGVVKLFNSVLQHQTMVKEKLKKGGTTESKREKVMSSVSKGEFIDKLKDKKKVSFFTNILNQHFTYLIQRRTGTCFTVLALSGSCIAAPFRGLLKTI